MVTKPTAEEFIGRDEEITFFREWLHYHDVSPIVYFHDALEEQEKKGGIGKTWLLHKLLTLVEEQYENIIPVTVDFFNVENRDGIVVAERVVQALQKKYPHWSPPSFDSILEKYHSVVQDKKMDTTTFRERLGDALASDLHLLYEQMYEANAYLLLFFDTFELIEHNPVTTVLRSWQTFPDNYGFDRVLTVIAGRNVLDWSHNNWIGRKHEINVRPLSPFNYDETVQYLTAYTYGCDVGQLPNQTLRALNDRTEGRPILVGLVTDVLNKQTKSVDELIKIREGQFEESLVEEINNFDNPIKWAVLFMAHIYHRFNETLWNLLMKQPSLKASFPRIGYQDMVRTLATLSFVRHSGSSDDFVLHDEMRRLVNRYCWERQDPDRRIRRDLSQITVSYYEDLMNHELDEEKRQSYIVEMLFHKAFIDLEQGFHFFDQHFYRSIDLSLRAFARSLFQEIHQFENRMSLEQRRRLQLAEARLLQAEESPEAALHIYEELEHDTDWAEAHRGELLYEKGDCYRQMSQFPEAIASLEAWRQREQSNIDMWRYARGLHLLGYIHRRLALYNDAMRFYETCERVLRNFDDQWLYATVLNDMGNVRRLQGKLDEALSLCKLALHIRREQFEQHKASELDVGLSLSTLGHIYHNKKNVIEEEHAYWEAFDIYNRVGSRGLIAATHNRLGRLHFVRGELEKAMLEFQQAYRIAQGINREAEIESLNQQGKVFLKTEKWEEAVRTFEKAIKLCQQVQDVFHESENRLYLTEALDHLGKPTQELVKEAKRIAYRIDHKFLLGLANRIQGDMHHRRHEYPATFRYYRVACKYMALYSPEEFEDIRDRLFDLLFNPEMPKNVLSGITDSMLEYWYDLGLDKAYPQIPRICQEARMHIVL